MTGFSPQERLARIRLARTDGIGAVGFGQLLARHGSGGAACEALAMAGKPLAPPQVAEAEMDRVAKLGGRHLLPGEDDYPPLLAALSDPPPLLIALGDTGLAARPVVAMVGARNASAAGRALARDMAADLGHAGWVVMSGLARGIDAAAHNATLDSGTIACIACGIDIAYPPEHAALQGEIAGRGLLLTELPPGTEPQARHFPRRNRLIAGIAQAVVVIEAASGSGSLITARIAADAGREVMAAPGHPADPRSRGGNGLIRDGATLVESAADVLAALSPFVVAARPARERPPETAKRRAPVIASGPVIEPGPVIESCPVGRAEAADGGFLALLSPGGVPVDELVRASGMAAAQVQAQLSDLEIEGRVVRLAGGRVARIG